MGNVKLHLKNGKREITLEGEMSDVDALMDKWWVSPSPSDDPADDEDVGGEDEPETGTNGASAAKAARPAKKRARRSATPSGDGMAARAAYDTNKFANDVKQDPKFERIKEKIILGSPKTWDQIAFVCWYAKEPLTSGDIKRCLEALGIKMDTPKVSHALSANSEKFLFSEQRVKGAIVRYTMTSAAIADFEKWFNGDA